jgi:hypothetical protein
MNLDQLFYFFSETYYTLPIMMVCQIVVVLIAVQNRRKFKELKHFHLYPIASFLQASTSVISMLEFDKTTSHKICEFTINIFIVIEVILIYRIAFNVIKIQKLRSVLILMLGAYALYTLYVWLYNGGLFDSSKIVPFEVTVLLLPTSFYFFQIFKQPPTFDLPDEPAFWINMGILFAFGCQLPLSTLEFFFQKFVYANFYFYYINFLSYTVLYLFVIRGYLSRRRRELPAKTLSDFRVYIGGIQ